MNSYAIVCQGCDRYSFIFKYFLDAIRPHLNEKKIFFCTEEIDVEDECVINIKTGPGSWSKRLKFILEHELLRDFDTVLYCQEDMLIKNIDWNTVNKCYEFHINNYADITKLGKNFEFRTFPATHAINGHPVCRQVLGDTYLVSHQPISFFKKEFLLNTLEGQEFGPSEHELLSSQRFDPNVYCVGNSRNPNRSLIVDYVHAIRQGELLPEGKDFINVIRKFNDSKSIQQI